MDANLQDVWELVGGRLVKQRAGFEDSTNKMSLKIWDTQKNLVGRAGSKRRTNKISLKQMTNTEKIEKIPWKDRFYIQGRRPESKRVKKSNRIRGSPDNILFQAYAKCSLLNYALARFTQVFINHLFFKPQWLDS